MFLGQRSSGSTAVASTPSITRLTIAWVTALALGVLGGEPDIIFGVFEAQRALTVLAEAASQDDWRAQCSRSTRSYQAALLA